jgi:hypothetical protein
MTAKNITKRFGLCIVFTLCAAKAIQEAAHVANATILADNSGPENVAFTVCRIQIGSREVYDCRNANGNAETVPSWMDIVSPRT